MSFRSGIIHLPLNVFRNLIKYLDYLTTVDLITAIIRENKPWLKTKLIIAKEHLTKLKPPKSKKTKKRRGPQLDFTKGDLRRKYSRFKRNPFK